MAVVALASAVVFLPGLARAWDRIDPADAPRSTGLSTGTDRVAVWICSVPSGTYTPDGPAIATWANGDVSSWFASMSGGKFVPQFEFLGTFSVAAGESTKAEMNACRAEAAKRTTAPYTNAMAVTTHSEHGGIGSYGYGDALTAAPTTSLRSFVVGGRIQVDDNDWLVGHELGHTLTWPHYFTGPTSEYDSPFDVMSGNKTTCRTCLFVHTIAVNRWFSGWIPDSDVVEHAGSAGSHSVQPHGTAGTKLVMVPTSSAGRYLSIEARTRTGGDQNLAKAGLLVSVIDTRPVACGRTTSSCQFTQRRQSPAVGAPGSYDSMLAPGESLVVDGITIANSGVSGSGWTASVSGVVSAPTRPQNFAVSSPSGKTARLTWVAPSSAGDQPVTAYVVTETSSGTTQCTTTSLTCDVTVSPGFRYRFSVTATSAVGAGLPANTEWTAPTSGTITVTSLPANLPGEYVYKDVPNQRIKVTKGDRSLRLSWKTVEGMDSYVVTDSRLRTVCTTTQPGCMVTELSPWGFHSFTVEARDSVNLFAAFLGQSSWVTPYRKVSSRTVRLSSIVPASVKPVNWRVRSGCRIAGSRLTLTTTRCLLTVRIRGTNTFVEVRR